MSYWDGGLVRGVPNDVFLDADLSIRDAASFRQQTKKVYSPLSHFWHGHSTTEH